MFTAEVFTLTAQIILQSQDPETRHPPPSSTPPPPPFPQASSDRPPEGAEGRLRVRIRHLCTPRRSLTGFTLIGLFWPSVSPRRRRRSPRSRPPTRSESLRALLTLPKLTSRPQDCIKIFGRYLDLCSCCVWLHISHATCFPSSTLTLSQFYASTMYIQTIVRLCVIWQGP